MTTTEPLPDEHVRDAAFDFRSYANDPDRIADFSRSNDDVNSLISVVEDNADAIFTWRYDKGERAALDKLYEKAKTSQWNGQTDLDWSIDVDPYAVLAPADPAEVAYFADNPDSPLHKFNEEEWLEVGVESMNWSLSQFMHGEQGALLCTAKIVETVPWIDAKYYAATQVVDEARHVEVFAQYLDQKLGGIKYPVNTHLGALLDDILEDSRWDMTYLGMQIMVEGLALAAFGFMHQTTEEPLLKKLLRYVMADEARHVAFGVLSLQEVYQELTVAELRERQEFTFEAALRMRDRFMRQEVWERMGIPVKDMVKFSLDMPDELRVFQKMLFSKIVPNCKKLGLLDAGDGWLRERFTDIGVIEFENWVDTGEEYADLDEVAKDRELARN
ncbi:MAG: ferritin-like domain-containing protein [Acidimicrobiales bacterium]|nr:ferritin-like domain-containing protein [Acidimicrobiales bacterium]